MALVTIDKDELAKVAYRIFGSNEFETVDLYEAERVRGAYTDAIRDALAELYSDDKINFRSALGVHHWQAAAPAPETRVEKPNAPKD